MAFTASLAFDSVLWPDDIAGSRAHVRGLARTGVITDAEAASVLARWTRSPSELGDGQFEFVDSDEDIHTAVERRVTELAGAAGAKLHTARSRNDQVATDLRLWCKRRCSTIAGQIVGAAGGARRPRRQGGRAPTCPVIPTSSERSQYCSAITFSPTAGRSGATSTACSMPSTGSTCRRSAPVRWPDRRLPIDPEALPTTSASPGLRQLARCGQRPGLRRRGDLRPHARRSPPRPDRRGMGAVDELTSSASSGSTTPIRPGRRCCRRRRTPTSPSWLGARRAGLIGNLTGSAGDIEGTPARLQPRSAGGQGAAVRLGRRRCRLAHRGARRG